MRTNKCRCLVIHRLGVVQEGFGSTMRIDGRRRGVEADGAIDQSHCRQVVVPGISLNGNPPFTHSNRFRNRFGLLCWWIESTFGSPWFRKCRIFLWDRCPRGYIIFRKMCEQEG